MSEKAKLDSSTLSAPLQENSVLNIIHQNSPFPNQQPSVPPVFLDPQPPANCRVGLPPYSEPPPSYQAAMAYPAASEPYQNQIHPRAPPIPLPSVTTQPPPFAVPTRGHCAYCGVGVLSAQTDLFCLIFLLLLAACLFPVGLLYLCFIPCTVHKRCSHCRRTL